jgi:hypothetical protein
MRRPDTHPPDAVCRADRRYAERLWTAASRGDRAAFDRIFEAWLLASYAVAWRACRDREIAQSRVREQMIEALDASLLAFRRAGVRSR